MAKDKKEIKKDEPEVSPCPDCNGSGVTDEGVCARCEGTGVEK